MPQKKKKAIYVSKLRQRAEEVLETSSGDNDYPVIFSSDEMKTLIHDFQVHQIELEMQNNELKRSEEEIDTARARYFDFFNMAPVGFFSVNEQKLILECNLTAAKLLERPRNTFIKQPITQFILKEDQDIYYLHNKQVFETKMSQECDLRMLKNDGSALWIHLSTTAVQNVEGDTVCRIVMSNITERKHAEDEIRKSEEKYRQLFESMTQGVFYQNADGTFLNINDAALEMFGLTRAQFFGRDPYDPRWKIIKKDNLLLRPDEYPSLRVLKTGEMIENFEMGIFNLM